jgi:hypothetical protein
MAYSYQQILEAQYARIADDHAQAAAELESGRVSEDAYRVTSAADRILELDQQRAALDARAHGFITSQQVQQQGNQFGLSRDEQDIAKVSGISDETYARNKQKMRAMKAEGYWDQGRVFK